MSKQESRDKGFHEKLKNLFRLGKGQGVTRSRSDECIVLSDDFVAELQSTSPISIRLRAAKELLDQLQTRRLENYSVEKLWNLLKDLLHPDMPRETRHLILELFASICRNHVEKSGAIRAKFFAFIQAHNVPEDSGLRFEFLKSLAKDGRDISDFNEKIGPFLRGWMSNSQNVFINTKDCMSFLINVIKFNQSVLDFEVLDEIIQNVCFICCTSSVQEDVLECLNVLSAVICYSSLPQNSLQTFLATLCRTVNVDYLGSNSWKIMRDLLGTHMGHSGLLQMCEFMETADVSEEVAVIRGAVFFVGAVLWGSQLVRSLKYSPSTVLAAFKKALERNHHVISNEVMIRVQDLVRNKGDTLQSVSWDLILEIIEKVLEYSLPENDGHSHIVIKCVNETLDIIEGAISSGGFCGSTQRFYAVVDAGVKYRPENSVCKLLQYKMNQYLRTTRPGWFNNLIAFGERHYRLETRPSIKVMALGHMTNVCLANLDTHEEDLVEKAIIPFMKNLETETDLLVRQQGVNFIVEFMLESTGKKGHDLLHVLERIVSRPFEAASSDMVNIYTEKEVLDVATGIQGLIRIFNRKIYHLPCSIPILAYNIIVRHLTQHYKRPATLDACYTLRLMIFECFFKIRANSMYHLGFPDSTAGSVVNYCAYLAVDHRDGEAVEDQLSSGSAHEAPQQGNTSSPPSTATQQQSGGNSSNATPPTLNLSTTLPQVTYISLTQACKLVVASLKKEKDWRVLELILKQIPNVMENKALILSKHGNDIDYLANAMCAMMMDKSVGFPDTLRNLPPKFQRSDVQSYMYPILTALVSYHSHLDSSVQLNIVKCLEHGLVSRNPRICILALSTCTLEMKDTMHKLLPQVLLSLSKITPKVNIAIPVLEFLSTLIHLPRVFASFVQDQYMSIFAIALPYTNPFKFNQYTVSLAHHVIAMWFLKCRLSFRRGFVSYIIKGLEANVWTPFAEENRRNALELQNEDSSNRKRSSSLTEQSNKRRERPISGQTATQGPPQPGPRTSHAQLPDLKPIPNKALMTFHQELTETCVDLMARYAFADCSALPTRFPSTNFLLTGGHSQTWLIDNKIITITTSGCSQKELRDGLCDKCWLLCRKPSPVITNPGTGSEDEGGDERSFISAVDSSRRRHRSAFAGSKKNEEPGGANDGNDVKAKDDLHLEHKLQLPPPRNPGGGDRSDETSGLMTDWTPTPKQKGDNSCCCWCQGWAEIHIRRPTGNTSWMMRVQNIIGNHAGADLPLRELSAMFLRNPDLDKQSHQASCSGPPSGSYTPARAPSIPNSGAGSPTRSINASVAVPSTPPSPSSPVPGSPTELKGIPVDTSGRTLVRRSNSSPEMSDSLRPGFISQQNLIQEQDEDELSLSSKSVLENSSSETNLSIRDEKRAEDAPTLFKQMERPATLGSSSSYLSKGGSTSPYRRSYEAIPEEVLSQKDTIHPLLSVSPSKREKLMTQHSVDDTVRSRAQGKDRSTTDNMQPVSRDRTFTIAVMSPSVRNKGLRRILSAGSSDASSMTVNRRDFESRSGSESSNIRSGISPSFVFLQLCAQDMFGQGIKPLLITAKMDNSVKNYGRGVARRGVQKMLLNASVKQNFLNWVLDYIQPFETHKIGVVYVGPGQVTNEAAILQNMYGSARFRDFLKRLGTLVKLRGVDPQKTYIGGLSSHGDDGEFAIIWQDDVMQVMFHVPTLMPNKDNDPACNAKKRHIGNDFVSIIYNNSGEDFDISTIKCQFLYACVIVEPLDHGTNRVLVKAKPLLADQIGHTEPKIVSDQNLPIMARQLALHSNLASVIFDNAQRDGAAPYASNWLERLRKIKQLRVRLIQDLGSAAGSSDEAAEFNTSASSQQKRPFTVDDFTEFV